MASISEFIVEFGPPGNFHIDFQMVSEFGGSCQIRAQVLETRVGMPCVPRVDSAFPPAPSLNVNGIDPCSI